MNNFLANNKEPTLCWISFSASFHMLKFFQLKKPKLAHICCPKRGAKRLAHKETQMLIHVVCRIWHSFLILYGLNLSLYSLFQVVRDKRTGKTKGYGFVSFSNPTDLAAAIKEMNGLYLNLCSADSVAATCLHVLIYCSISLVNKTSFRKVCR